NLCPFYRRAWCWTRGRQTLPGRRPANSARPERWSSSTDSATDGRDGRNPVRPGANTVSDTRALLSRIAEFRKRLEAMPRLGSVEGPAAGPQPTPEPIPQTTEPASRTQAMVLDSLRQLAGTAEVTPHLLTNRARRLLIEAHGLVTRLRAL